jgi:hypothetical protein
MELVNCITGLRKVVPLPIDRCQATSAAGLRSITFAADQSAQRAAVLAMINRRRIGSGSRSQ